MASIWLDSIDHEVQGYHCDTIKLRRPMLVQQIRLASTQTQFSRLEFMAKNLRTPSDDPVLIKKIPKLQENSGMDVWPLSEPILTNHLVVKGEYKKLSLCLEANEAVLKQESIVIRPVKAIVRPKPRCSSSLAPLCSVTASTSIGSTKTTAGPSCFQFPPSRLSPASHLPSSRFGRALPCRTTTLVQARLLLFVLS